MTRMSDALRAAAENAPVDEVHVSTAHASRRVRRNRTVRSSANVLAGAGAIAIVVAGLAIGPAEFASPARDLNTEANGEGGGTEPAMDDAMLPMWEGNPMCGATFDASAYAPSDVKASATIGAADDTAATLTTTLTAADGGGGFGYLPTTYILWGDLVVGMVSNDTYFPADESGTTSFDTEVALVNCWDGAALPAGEYSLVSVSSIQPNAFEEVPEEISPDEPVSSDDGTVTTDDGTVTTDDADDAGASVSSDVAVAPETFAVAEPVAASVSGDMIDDPFGQYLNPVKPVDPVTPVVPDGVLTPDEARAAYEAAATKVIWDMAEGTQRVVMTYNGTDQDMWADTYFGCPNGDGGGAFPSTSADLDWLDVSATLPASISVSYGWVVDGNPTVSLTATNVSDWTLPGFWGQPSSALYLVKDGRVVAEAYPVNIDRDGGAIAFDDAMELSIAQQGYLEPGKSLGGEYIWRDVNGCWTAAGPSNVDPGTYTVLTAQDIYVGGGMVYPAEGDMALQRRADAEATREGGSDGVSEPAIDIAPAPGTDDFANFQVWTSLGTVTITP